MPRVMILIAEDDIQLVNCDGPVEVIVFHHEQVENLAAGESYSVIDTAQFTPEEFDERLEGWIDGISNEAGKAAFLRYLNR